MPIGKIRQFYKLLEEGCRLLRAAKMQLEKLASAYREA